MQFDGNAYVQQAFYDFTQGWPPFPYGLPVTINATGSEGGDTLLGSDYAVQMRYVGPGYVYDIAPGADTLSGGGGNDYIDGRGQNDSLSGGAGEDTVVGGDGDDWMHGNMGSDHLEGRNGADSIHGGQGNDLILGGAGNDYISGDAGYNELWGGTGADIFHTSSVITQDWVRDFNYAEGDRVLVDGPYSAFQEGTWVVVEMTGGVRLNIENGDLASWGSDWIVSG